jgi:hypothetical protein
MSRAVKKPRTSRENERFVAAVKRAMQKAARRARELARMHGTPLVLWQNGRVVLKKL